MVIVAMMITIVSTSSGVTGGQVLGRRGAVIARIARRTDQQPV
jgi:hypothetical protein